MESFKAKVRLKDGSKITVFLDTGVEINIMTREVMEDTSLVMQRGPKLELVSYTSHSRSFIRFCENIKVVIGGFETRYSIFVIETRDHNLVLNYLFLNSIKFSQKYRSNAIFGTITHFYTYQLTMFWTLASQNLANRIVYQIFTQFLS